MISIEQARELLNASETYGDRERRYGRELEKRPRGGPADGILEERYDLLIGELNEVKRILRSLMTTLAICSTSRIAAKRAAMIQAFRLSRDGCLRHDPTHESHRRGTHHHHLVGIRPLGY